MSPAFFSAFCALASVPLHTWGTVACFAAMPTMTDTALPGLRGTPASGFWPTILPTSLAATTLVLAGALESSRPMCSRNFCTAEAFWFSRFGVEMVGGCCSSLTAATPRASAATSAIGTHQANHGRCRNTASRLMTVSSLPGGFALI